MTIRRTRASAAVWGGDRDSFRLSHPFLIGALSLPKASNADLRRFAGTKFLLRGFQTNVVVRDCTGLRRLRIVLFVSPGQACNDEGRPAKCAAQSVAVTAAVSSATVPASNMASAAAVTAA